MDQRPGGRKEFVSRLDPNLKNSSITNSSHRTGGPSTLDCHAAALSIRPDSPSESPPPAQFLT